MIELRIAGLVAHPDLAGVLAGHSVFQSMRINSGLNTLTPRGAGITVTVINSSTILPRCRGDSRSQCSLIVIATVGEQISDRAGAGRVGEHRIHTGDLGAQIAGAAAQLAGVDGALANIAANSSRRA